MVPINWSQMSQLDAGAPSSSCFRKPYDEYRSELSAEGAAALDELAARPEATVAIVVAWQDPARADGDPGLPYHRLGLYLAKTAHVLIALWDGEMERKPGGTLDVLTSFLDRQFDSDPGDALPDPIQTTDIPPDDAGPTAVWVRGSRAGSDATDSSAIEPAVYVGPSGLPGVWHGSHTMPPALADMVEDLSRTRIESIRTDAAVLGYPLLEEVPDDLAPARRSASDDIQTAYLAADRLAMLNQRRSDFGLHRCEPDRSRDGFRVPLVRQD